MIDGTDRTIAPAALPPVLHVEGLSKTFGGARALDGVGFEVGAGEVHGLLGKNGSGKSTLIKILAGFHAPDPGGRLRFNGEEVAMPLRPGDFRRLGMAFVHQHLGLVPSLSVLENLRFAQLGGATGPWIDWRKERRLASEALGRFGLDLDPSERVARLSAVDQALLAIVRAFEEVRQATAASGRPGLLLLDEPTPFLPQEGVERLFGLVRDIVRTGSSVIFISHDIDEVRTITDRATVLRDGRLAGSLVTRDAGHADFVELILGRKLARLEGSRHAETTSFPPFVRIDRLAAPGIAPASLSVGRGEILGLTGLIGSGFEKLPYLMFGATRAAGGTMTLDGAAVDVTTLTPRRSLDLGLALLPGDRNGAGLVGALPVFENMFLPDLERFFTAGRLRFGAMRKEARTLGQRFELKPNDPEIAISALSGGNAQKVMLARLLNRRPRLLLLDEPTQGVDVGTRALIFNELRQAAAAGMSIVCASSDAEQLAEIADRVLVLARGAICDELTGPRLSKSGIAEACYSSTGQDRPVHQPA